MPDFTTSAGTAPGETTRYADMGYDSATLTPVVQGGSGSGEIDGQIPSGPIPEYPSIASIEEALDRTEARDYQESIPLIWRETIPDPSNTYARYNTYTPLETPEPRFTATVSVAERRAIEELQRRALEPLSIQPTLPTMPTSQRNCHGCARPSENFTAITWRSGPYSEIQEWCDKCITHYSFTCAECQERMSVGSRSSHRPDMCNTCFAIKYFYCTDCSSILTIDQRHSSDRCHNCSLGRVESYNFEVPSMIKLGRGPQYFGVELEVESRGSANFKSIVATMKKIVDGFAILKHDGSLSNGFEIATIPASLDVQIEKWSSVLTDPIMKNLKSWNTPTCGLHVHASRSPLTSLHISKIVCFVNASYNRRFIFVMAGRNAEDWAKFKYKTMDNALNHESKYEAVNLMHSNTIEFRIFRGTTKKESVFKAIEFCAALIAFTKSTKNLNDCMKHSRFTAFVHKHENKYPHLEAYIQAKWLGKMTDNTEKFGYKPIKIREVKPPQDSDIDE